VLYLLTVTEISFITEIEGKLKLLM